MRIVIVDSEETSREVIKQAINTVVETHKIKSGCKIVGEAADGRKGCEIIVKERPDLIIMDLELPGKNGLPLLKKIRSEQIHSRVLVITKDNDFDRTRQAISFGVDEYLLKPVKKVQIAKALQMIEDITDVHQMTNQQLKRLIQKIEVDKEGNVDIYLRLLGDLGLDESVLIEENETILNCNDQT